MRLLLWHVHGSWTTAFVQGQHEYVIPVLPDRGPDGRGRARTWTWPDTVVERAPQELGDIDVVVLQKAARAGPGPRVDRTHRYSRRLRRAQRS
jgi:hypothetical protein